jgi:hypothetical protein
MEKVVKFQVLAMKELGYGQRSFAMEVWGEP